MSQWCAQHYTALISSHAHSCTGLHVSCDIRVIVVNLEYHWSNGPASAFDLLVARMSEMSVRKIQKASLNVTISIFSHYNYADTMPLILHTKLQTVFPVCCLITTISLAWYTNLYPSLVDFVVDNLSPA